MQICLVELPVLNPGGAISGFISFHLAIFLQKYLMQVLPKSHFNDYLMCDNGVQNSEMHPAQGIQ